MRSTWISSLQSHLGGSSRLVIASGACEKVLTTASIVENWFRVVLVMVLVLCGFGYMAVSDAGYWVMSRCIMCASP